MLTSSPSAQDQSVDFSGKRMIDHLLAMPEFVPVQPGQVLELVPFREQEQEIRRRLKNAQVFEITNIADYFWEGSSQEEWDVFSDFPCIMSPFENVWFEYRAPAKIVSNTCGTREWDGAFSRCGVLVSTTPCPPDLRTGVDKVKNFQLSSLFFQSFPNHPAGSIRGPLMSIGYWVTESGEPKTANGKSIMAIPMHKPEYSDLPRSKHYNIYHNALYPVLLALTFINCRNTVICERKPDAKLSAVHDRKYGKPLVKFKILEIEPVKRIFERHAGSGVPLKRALHVCRGHFKDYREHGLFGRNKGLYWWGNQVRGTSERGIVVKDYEMGMPQDLPK